MNTWKIPAMIFCSMLCNDQDTDEDFLQKPGPTTLQNDRLTPVQCFSLFFTNAVWEFLVRRTNEHADRKVSIPKNDQGMATGSLSQ